MKNSKEAKRLLWKFITSGPDSAGEYSARCPIHDDSKPSASFNFDIGVWNCQGCSAAGKIVDLIYRLQQSGDIEAKVIDLDQERLERKGTLAEEINLEEVASRHRELLARESEMFWLLDHRGLTEHTIRMFQLGWSESKKSYVVPIFDANNKLINLRFYKPGDPNRKWSSVKGSGSAALFPIEQIDSNEVLVCEGEMDAMLAVQNGFATVTGTGGAGFWDNSWGVLFEGKRVFICYDCDKAGLAGAKKVQASLGSHAESITLIDLGFTLKEDHGEDLTDYLLRHGKDKFEALKAGAEPTPEEELGDGFNNTDLGNSERLFKRFGDILRYVTRWKSWVIWNDKYWEMDELENVFNKAAETVRAISKEALTLDDQEKRKDLIGYSIKSESLNKINAMITAGEKHPKMAVKTDTFDRNLWLLNCQNGTINLKTGELRPHDRADMITQIVPVGFEPEAKCDRWVRFVEEILPTLDDQEFLQRAVGYSLTGVTTARVMIILYGHGSNGKSVLLEVIRALLGDYAKTADSDLLMQKKEKTSGGASGQIARLRGARFVTSSETEENQRMDENAIKEMVGGDTITARHLYQSEFEFEPTHKLWMATNHKPKIVGVDNGIWRRIRLLPFDQVFPPDADLIDELKSELTGILGWALKGCLDWQKDGLGESDNVIQATQEYRDSEDILGRFLDERCDKDDSFKILLQDLFAVYEDWSKEQNLNVGNKFLFGKKLNDRVGTKTKRYGHKKDTYVFGVKLK